MKYLKYITNGALFALLLAGCSDDLDNKPVVLPVSGDEIEFGAASGGFTDVNPESRTIYDVPAGSTFDNYQLLNIKWQYGIDQVRVYCPEGADGFRTADYTVKEATDASSGTSTGFLVKNGETGVRWGDTGETHNFYAFYSLGKIDEGLQTGTTVKATIPTGQEGGELKTYNNKGEEDENGTFKVITPDMTFCMMAGKGTWNPGTDKNVALTFKPIVTVLDVLVNGPSDVEFMNIVSISVRSKSGKNIVGTFSYDVKSGKYDFSATDGSNTATSIATVQTVINGNPVKLEKGHQLNVKFFLLPRGLDYYIKDDLVVSVLTEGGVVYSKTISGTSTSGGDGVLGAGLITRIKTPKLGGQEANNWMSQIPDNALFTQLSLPGSKNSFAYRVDAGYDPQTGLSKFYQALPPLGINATVETTTQFDEGIRVFDVHLNIDRRTPVVYAGGANVSPQITLETVLNTLRDKVNPNNETASECAVVFLNYVNDGYTVSEWLPMVMDALDSWNSSNGGILTTLDQNTTMGDVRGNVAVIINLQTSDRPEGSAPVNYINNFSTSVQNTSIVSAPYSSGATVRIQNLQQCNNPEITSGETPYVYKGEGIGLVPYFITRENKLDGTSFNLIETKRNLMKELNREIARGGQHLYINDLSGFCVTKNASSTGYLNYDAYVCEDYWAFGTRYRWSSVDGESGGPIYDYANFPLDESDYVGVSSSAERPEASSNYLGKKWLVTAGNDLGNGGNTCLFAELFNGEAVAEYSSLIGDLRQPLGIVLMNFAGVATVDASNRSYAVQGIRLPGLIMMNNFMFPLKTGTTTTRSSSDTSYSKEGNVWD